MTEAILLLLFMVGILVLYLPELGDMWRIMRFRILQWKESFQLEEGWLQSRKESYQQKFPEYIRRLLQVTLSAGTRKGVRYFFLLSVSSGTVMFLFMICQASLFTAAGASAAMAVMPYLLLRCMVQEKQVAGSHEGEILVTEILNNYKIHYCNMVTAIEVTAVTMEGAPYCRQLLFNLSRGLNRMSGNRDLELLMEEYLRLYGIVKPEYGEQSDFVELAKKEILRCRDYADAPSVEPEKPLLFQYQPVY